MSDDAYLSFLDKANKDLDAGRQTQTQPQTQSQGDGRTKSLDVAASEIPAPLMGVEVYYVSETDEPFEPVVLAWEGAKRGVWPGTKQFASLISSNEPPVETMSPASFDPRDQYASVFKAVRAAVGGSEVDQAGVDVKVYRVEVGSSTVEYWVVALDAGGRLVGLKAQGVET
ncbi:hypothetical protein ASPZODRAFT_15772 [Penicilliopsis zonata CBS 506.65]|uniref:Uncharacterized protein n=1 Tax=Penicilliopsis zonata CBS 506.65 TaxID=1073090 RepID=A0A1L9SIP3_9EURO|nr:hypothetical protein ASPZODRAFT_15772 [Penicilliopsis zonata CBS 506.65]OJJ47089.1 hypothetical protein ASPZODRAFT_15772 [Penicilliopsis zonata CBS 506.65]